jgi:hypothetical protein
MMRQATRFAVLFGFAALGAGCIDSGRRITAIDPEPAPMSATSKRIASDGAGGLILPDGARVEVDQSGGFELPNGAYVRRDRSGALNLPNGSRCVPDGRSGYLCP